jgi:hypothetical protein
VNDVVVFPSLIENVIMMNNAMLTDAPELTKTFTFVSPIKIWVSGDSAVVDESVKQLSYLFLSCSIFLMFLTDFFADLQNLAKWPVFPQLWHSFPCAGQDCTPFL